MFVELDDVMLSAISGLLNDITLWDEDEVIGRGVQVRPRLVTIHGLNSN